MKRVLSIFGFILIIAGSLYLGRHEFLVSTNELYENISIDSLTNSIKRELYLDYNLKPKAINEKATAFVFQENSNILDAKEIVSKLASKYKLKVAKDWEYDNVDGNEITGIIYTFKDKKNYFYLVFVYNEAENAISFGTQEY